MKSLFFLVASALSLFILSHVDATHGTIPVGFGTKSIGMGGVAAAYPQDTIISAINPAGMYWVANELDLGLQLFTPFRRYSYNADSVRSGRNYFWIPHIGYSQRLNCWSVVGISLYGQGGMNTKYPRNNPVFGERKLGVDYLIGTIAPTIAFRIFPDWLPCHTIGIAPLFSVQTIKLSGLQNFGVFSAEPDRVSNNKYNWSYGFGARFGWMGRILPCLWKFGALWGGIAYSTKVYMTRFHRYAGLFPERGRVDIPALLTAGIKLELTRCMNFAFDYWRVFYSNVKAFNNPIERLFEGNQLGSNDGPGFGWEDVNIYKFGIDYRFNCAWTVRAGASFGNVPYDSSQIDFNIIAPAVIRSHLTLGATWRCNPCHEFDFAYAYAFKNRRKGVSRFGLGTVTHEMYQHLAEINYCVRF